MANYFSIKFWEYSYLSPQWLWFLLIIPIIILIKIFFNKTEGAYKFTRPAKDLDELEAKSFKWIVLGVKSLLYIGLAILIIGLADPYHPSVDQAEEKEYSEGIDIVIAMDISGSMMATDFLPNRLEAAKDVAKDFIDGRKDDKIGFVVFEGEAYTACPTTRNHTFLKTCIDKVESGWLPSGTAIGTGLGTAVTRLRSDSLASKVIILLTDGESNGGVISPTAAAELAKSKDITVYTIGVGKDGFSTISGFFSGGFSSIDEGTLKKIAKITSGRYFRATDKSSLAKIYKIIEEMETRKIVDENFHKDPPLSPLAFIIYGLIFVLISWSVQHLIFRKVG